MFYLHHLFLVRWMYAHRPTPRRPFPFGSLTPRMPAPLYANWDVHLSWWLVPALAVLATTFTACAWLVMRSRGRERLVLIGAPLLFVAMALSVCMADGYRRAGDGRLLPALVLPYARVDAVGRPMEFYGDAAVVREVGVTPFLREFQTARVFLRLSGHGQTHPPGPALFLWAVGELFGPGLLPASFATVLFAALATLPVYLLATDLGGKGLGRTSLVIFLLTPNVIMFSATSMDGPAMVFPITSLWLFHRAMSRGLWPWAPLAGAALAAACFMTYATLGMIVFLSVMGVLAFYRAMRRPDAAADPDAARRVRQALLVTFLTPCLLFTILRSATGFNIVTSALNSVKKDAANRVSGYGGFERYLQFSLGNLSAFLIGVGVASAAAWVAAGWGAMRRGVDVGGPESEANQASGITDFIRASVVTLPLLAFSTLFTLEVERIWIFLTPLVVIPVAVRVRRLMDANASAAPFWWLAGLLAVQMLAFEVMLDTFW